MNAGSTPAAITSGVMKPWKGMVREEYAETDGDSRIAITSTPSQKLYEVNALSPAVVRHQRSSFAVRQPPLLRTELHSCYLREGNLALFSFTGWLATRVLRSNLVDIIDEFIPLFVLL